MPSCRFADGLASDCSSRLTCGETCDGALLARRIAVVLEFRLRTQIAKSSGQLLEEAMQLHRNGRLADAALRYRQVTRIEPRNVDAMRLLGSVRMGQGNVADAERWFRKALLIDPNSAAAHVEYGVVLCRLGRFADAVESYRRALEMKPDHAGAHNNLGIVLRDLGQLDEAIASYRRAVEIEPGYVEAYYNLGNALMGASLVDEAIINYQAAIASKPAYAYAHNNLGNALRQRSRLDEAAASYLRAVAADPNLAAAHHNLGIVEFESNRFTEAISHYQRALAIDPNYAEVHNDLGNSFRMLARFDEALECYNRALAIKPDYAEAHNNLGVALKMLGRIEEARRAFAKAIELAPKRVLFYAGLADSTRFADGDRHLAAMEQLAQDQATLDGEERIQLHFALGKAFADLARYGRSFRHLLAGNTLKRQQITYDETTVLGEFGRIRAVFTPTLMTDRRGQGEPSSAPVFIVGLPRSGTTLVEQILASHPKLHGAGELTDFHDAVVRLAVREGVLQPYPELVSNLTGPNLREIGADYLARVRGLAPSAERITDKMPGNFLAAGLIHLALPNARIIHTQRDPIDTCVSCFSTLFAADHPHAYDLGELGRYYRAYAALMGHWRDVLPEGIMIDVQYETLVTDFEPQARRIVAHCGLDWDDACLAFHRTQRPVRTASMVQVRQPIYQSSIGRWRPYRSWLEPLLAALDVDPQTAL
jgi:tetratricopeptide (TPR) repeat protein